MSAPVLSSSKADTAPRAKPQRVLACVLCQQRKIKCDRKFPCAHCTKHQLHCVPATQTRPRRRRFPERELLDRLRKYEGLLRQNKVEFEPLHGDLGTRYGKSVDDSGGSDDEHRSEGTGMPSPSITVKSETSYEPKNFWHLVSPELEASHAGLRETIRQTWDQTCDSDDHILFGSSDRSSVDLSTFHPEPVHIFRLWQIYLDNVNALLRVTHAPSFQARIIEAVSSIENMSPALEALMFSMYSMAISSLTEEACYDTFKQPRALLLTKYQFGCQQALANSQFLRTTDIDCLTALFLYLHASRPAAHIRSISSLLSVAIRIAQRMGLQHESANARCTILEAEMRRRLWWSLVLFDARMSGLSEHKATELTPTWDCAVPLNVGDSELRAEMKEPPRAEMKVSEALFSVLAAELADFARHTPFYLDMTNPILRPIAKELPGGGKVDWLEKSVEERYLRYCDLENPTHFMAMWMSRASLSKFRLMENSHSYLMEPDEERYKITLSSALRWLHCDAKLAASPLTQRFRWFLQIYYPFPAYIRITQFLKLNPLDSKAEYIWNALSDHFEARFEQLMPGYSPVFIPFSEVIISTWEVLATALRDSGQPVVPPRIVTKVQERLLEVTPTPSPQSPTAEAMGMGSYDFGASIPMDFVGHSLNYDQITFSPTNNALYPNISMPDTHGINVDQFNWDSLDLGQHGQAT
ncbi:hypothetical protein CORC01_10847 [Colletotrichum orchidophilum]|uniref:Zn(2)-C6 fungal-type domain-containing protein n=1 Tax=Colletotrichum orchidophilum TaxID=1209926 RepID=A0A1G4AXI0_9PEZI|nr:uncharacterized protein CORC01_10847 [Colletotrichum orchidophilum]OHE93826.1 hypothetical protein CORC01_10847 [Colletotrichum orchidophilum]